MLIKIRCSHKNATPIAEIIQGEGGELAKHKDLLAHSPQKPTANDQ